MSYTLSDDSLINELASRNRIYFASRITVAPKIDGRLTDFCWQEIGEWQDNFIQQTPHQAKAPSQKTEIKVLYDNKFIYVGIICHDTEPEKMNPILGRRDYINGDMAGIAFDSYNDNRTAFEFNLSAAGQKVDLMHLGEYNWDYNWDAVWDGKTTLGDSAWFAEMRIPFTQLRYSNEKEQIWGMHVWRWIHRLNEESQWKLIPIEAPAMVYIFGELKGIKDIPYKRNVELLPYTRGAYSNIENQKFSWGAGVDGKLGISSNFNLDYTINPDFGQVEADPSVLNLTSYEVFYEEKRPFFLEGNSIMEYTIGRDLLYYSRRIGDAPSYSPLVDEDDLKEMPRNNTILGALKFTGKNKSGLSVGIVNGLTSREVASVDQDGDSEDIAVEPLTNFLIGRVKQEWNKGNTFLGGMFSNTHRSIKDEQLEFLPMDATVGALDFEHNWKNRKYYLSGKTFYSNISGSEESISRLQRNSRHLFQRVDADHLDYDPDRTALDGWGGEISGGKSSGKFSLTGTVDWRSPGVDFNDVGYMRQADFIVEEISGLFQVNKASQFLLNYYFMLDQRHHWSYGGENTKDELDSRFQLRFKNYWRFTVDLDRTYNILDTRQLRGGPALRIDPNTSLNFLLQSNRGKKVIMESMVDFTTYDEQVSWKNKYDLSLKWNVSNSFLLSTKYGLSNEHDNSQYVFQKNIEDERRYYVGKIDRTTLFATLRAEYFVTPEISFQYYGSPYTSIGKYLDYREVKDARSISLEDRYAPLTEIETSDGKWLIDEEGNLVHDFADWDPDFNFQEFSSNFVARWEYKTGSTLYFVWTNYRWNYNDNSEQSTLEAFGKIFKVPAENVFMLKLSYWFSL